MPRVVLPAGSDSRSVVNVQIQIVAELWCCSFYEAHRGKELVRMSVDLYGARCTCYLWLASRRVTRAALALERLGSVDHRVMVKD